MGALRAAQARWAANRDQLSETNKTRRLEHGKRVQTAPLRGGWEGNLPGRAPSPGYTENPKAVWGAPILAKRGRVRSPWKQGRGLDTHSHGNRGGVGSLWRPDRGLYWEMLQEGAQVLRPQGSPQPRPRLVPPFTSAAPGNGGSDSFSSPQRHHDCPHLPERHFRFRFPEEGGEPGFASPRRCWLV